VSSHRVLCLLHTPNPHLAEGELSPLKRQAAPLHVLEQRGLLHLVQPSPRCCPHRGCAPGSAWQGEPVPAPQAAARVPKHCRRLWDPMAAAGTQPLHVPPAKASSRACSSLSSQSSILSLGRALQGEKVPGLTCCRAAPQEAGSNNSD